MSNKGSVTYTIFTRDMYGDMFVAQGNELSQNVTHVERDEQGFVTIYGTEGREQPLLQVILSNNLVELIKSL